MQDGIMESHSLNRPYRYWTFLQLVGKRYPSLLLEKVLTGHHHLTRRDLPKFSGNGLEIGGPSQLFRRGKEFPIYSVAGNVDNVNYGSQTFWEGTLQEGRNFKYNPKKEPGHQFICEASDLSPIPDCAYDFVASCHTLEHCANPIKALIEWRRILRDNGWLVLVLPHRTGTFDHRRKVTEFEHLLEDYCKGVMEDDTTHFAEILEKHDLKRDPAQKSRVEFERWITTNAMTRGAHHHVFDPALAIRLVDYAGFEVVTAEVALPFHIFTVAQKSTRARTEKERTLSQVLQGCYARSPFKVDRQNVPPGILTRPLPTAVDG
jgi:SAM-dependent methyltransferase